MTKGEVNRVNSVEEIDEHIRNSYKTCMKLLKKEL